MKIYLAGPMRGLELFNFPAFMKAAMDLREQGHEVVNPAERDMALGFNPAEPIDSPNNAEVFDLGEAFQWDFQAIMKSDAIVLLPAWRESKGTQAELVLSMAMQKEIYYWEPIAQTMVNASFDEYIVSFGTGLGKVRDEVLERMDARVETKEDTFDYNAAEADA